MDAFEQLDCVSSLDGSREPFLLSLPPGGEASALVVGLHTWSADRFNQVERMGPYCRERGWALLLPEFRGPNLTTNPRVRQAGGSALARRDVIDATRLVLEKYVDPAHPRFLVGGSGGGHMALQVAGREALDWTAVSSWCPITDLAEWHRFANGYLPHVESVCGGAPGDSPEVDAAYTDRSPIHRAAALAKCRLQLGHGRYDKVVPYRHAWEMALAIEAQKPEAFFFSLFDGGHQILFDEAFKFFDASIRKEQGVELTG